MAFKFPEENWQVLLLPERESWQSLESFFNAVKPQPEEVWADIGCGPGYFTLPLAERVKKVYAIDSSEFMLQRCKERTQAVGLERVEYLQCTEDKIPLGDKEVDHSLLANLFHELLNPEAFMREVKRITRERIILIDWHPIPSPAGPPIEERVPEERAIEFMTSLGFRLLEKHKVYPYHYFLVFKGG
ncbi:MAG: class I SAM-dependent methyltransferase [Aquificaceae bacterium]|nr:class I SAM-dependent methyltransferase [Aquificaceae bacterium]MDW8295207.1 class I SAM-dependent methyltransferase [Aquificaceae bacterium]MDW8422841.1 class I SAM-dependent methyltransferase [Aquificaceae bacterium]